MISTAGVRNGYDLWASSYDEEVNVLVAIDQSYEGLRCRGAMAMPSITGAALDVGCGTGRHLPLLESSFSRVVGIDLSEGMLEQARKKITRPTTRLIIGDFLTADIQGPFDYIHSSLALMHFDDLTQFFSRAANLLSPRGRLYITDADETLLKNGTTPNFSFRGRDHKIDHKVNTIENIETALANADLAAVEVGRTCPSDQVISLHPKFSRYRGQPCLFYVVAERRSGE